MRVAYFGGSFDPFHFGHLNLIIALRESGRFDHIVVSPAALSPFKTGHRASDENRLQMVRLGVELFEDVSVWDGEFALPRPSYSMDVMPEFEVWLGKKWPGITFSISIVFFEEMLARLHEWKEYEKLFNCYTPVVCVDNRSKELKTTCLSLTLSEKLVKNSLQVSFMEISSTMIRERLKNKLFCSHLVPGKVLDYILEEELY